MKIRHVLSLALLLGLAAALRAAEPASPARAIDLRTEYLVAPEGIDVRAPRLSWRLEAAHRGAAQTAWQVRVASSHEKLLRGEADLWDSGRKPGASTHHVAYAGRPLAAGAGCFWQVRVWDEAQRVSGWSEPARWSMGILTAADWKAQWISFRDMSPLHTSRKELYLPPARHYRKEFTAAKSVRRAVVYAAGARACTICTATGNGSATPTSSPVGRTICKRAYYRAHDITALRAGGRRQRPRRRRGRGLVLGLRRLRRCSSATARTKRRPLLLRQDAGLRWRSWRSNTRTARTRRWSPTPPGA
jgi:alpha-L-rhamnosidase